MLSSGKPKDEMGGGWSGGSNQWGPGPTGPGAANNGGSGGWGGPPPSGPKANPSWGGAGSGLGGPPGGAGGAPGQGPRGGAPQWEEQSPTMARRFDDGGTGIWGGGGGSKSAMPGGPPGGKYIIFSCHKIIKRVSTHAVHFNDHMRVFASLRTIAAVWALRDVSCV